MSDDPTESPNDVPRESPHVAHPRRSRAGRVLWISLGTLCVAIGAVGVVLPGLPTTPFLILAAACYIRSSQQLYDRVLANRWFGPAVRRFREGGGVSIRVKALAISTMAVFVGFALVFGIPREWTAVRILVAVCAVIGAFYILRLPTHRHPPGD